MASPLSLAVIIPPALCNRDFQALFEYRTIRETRFNPVKITLLVSTMPPPEKSPVKTALKP
jgi:hypothetical protein